MGFFKPPRLPFDERPKLVTQDDLEQFKEQAGASLLALNRLQELDLSACPRITDSSVTQVGERRKWHLENTEKNKIIYGSSPSRWCVTQICSASRSPC